VSRFLVDQHPSVPTKRELVDGEVDLVFGGPPCQGFSQIGPRDLKDPRNLLYLEFARVLKALKPRVFVMENVPNMVAMKNGHFRDLILAAGYHDTILTTLTASDFGVPQHRRRVFFVGTRDDLPASPDLASRFERYLDASRSDRETTVAEAISDLPKRVSLDDGPLPYPKLRRKMPSDFQRSMRLDLESPLMPRQFGVAGVVQLAGEYLLSRHHRAVSRRQPVRRESGPDDGRVAYYLSNSTVSRNGRCGLDRIATSSWCRRSSERYFMKVVLPFFATTEELARIRAHLPAHTAIFSPKTKPGFSRLECTLRDLGNELADADAVMGWVMPPGAFERAKNLKALVWLHSGCDELDFGMLKERGIAVANVRGANAVSVAEQGMAQKLLHQRSGGAPDRSLRASCT
jgi:site-specific DNA-cytosine methylase